ncbi:CehA/McbA family metallohydrolase [Phenylobacterium sp.]|uniref:CehA/McbA family metallohydrolase n=1 Tax=Phenylobacterium sp. TaxID=1871053 RepID=UPI0012098B76|nr:CehA/McbA family metallohydrolase [Phenylobacterium sp.]THD60459.1 MAG: histidinol-phosphatase [Phenylobacterium sp.]
MRSLVLAAGLLLAAVSTGAGAAPYQPPKSVPPVASLADGIWLKGDLHIHSRHSKDSSNNPVKKIVALAEAVHMDYLLISDHDNHVNGDVAHNTWTDPEYVSKSVLLLYGAEWTTHRGHGTAISAVPYDHQALYDVADDRDVAIAAVKKKLGIHLSANHPGTHDAFAFSYDFVDSVECWNSAVWANNAINMHIWDDMLKSGRKMPCRGGSDSHHGVPDSPELTTPLSYQAPENNVGTPTTWVFAKARTRQAVVDALTNGRVAIAANPYTPRVDFTADLNGDGKPDVMQGDNAKPTGQPVAFRVALVGQTDPAATYTVQVVKNGDKFTTLTFSGAKPEITFTDTPSATARSYYRVEVHGPATPYPQVPGSMKLSGDMLGLSNAICFNFDPKF